MRRGMMLVVGLVMLMTVNAFCMNIDVMMPVLEKAKGGIKTMFSSINKDLSDAARKLSRVDFEGEEARRILNGLSGGRDYVVDCAIIDTAGKMVVVEPQEYRKYEGEDVSRQVHIAELLKTKRPILSGVFLSVEGIEVVDFIYPVFSDKGEFLGGVSMLVRQQALTGDIIAPLVRDVPCKAWVMQKDGLIIYDPDPNQIGRDIFTDDFFRPFEDLISFSETVSRATDGAGSYDFYAKGLEDKTVVKKYAAWDTVSLYGTQWRIVVMEVDRPAIVIKDPDRSKK
ncbi:hypothetical protein BU251_01740 [Candidatus Velamenicoccus archaeovorus]|uniref:Dret-0059-like sensor domain-containing protein n=1 Tax=Velamenicoccus archaeovorus TaxID=1930593 RepID=A0A410P2V9_VELA1|nr:cache domain-containing protein [Candidatus Velamenicoccus archaeovorus]QAT16537.1 hypothetical protein BU251_01740 [Candidatus Velamenicoccus archaeovorus]